MTEKPAETRSGRLRLLLVAALFSAPVVAAYLVYFGPDAWKPETSVANGRLISPARPLPALAWQPLDGEAAVQGKWTLLQIQAGDCGPDCLQRVHDLRQLRTSLHRHRSRVQRLWVHPDEAAARRWSRELGVDHPRLRHAVLAPDELARLRAFFGEVPETQPVFLIDPLGNWLMVYGEAVPLRGMYKDLKRLLKLSNIG